MSKKSVVAIVAIVMVLAGLFLVGTEFAFSNDDDPLYDSRDVAVAEMLQMHLATVTEVRKARIANAEVWIKGNSNEELTPAEEAIYAELVFMQNDLTWFWQAQEQALGLDDWTGVPEADLAAFLHKHPLARSLWKARERRLTTHRTMIRPDFAPTWETRVEGAIAVFEEAAENEE